MEQTKVEELTDNIRDYVNTRYELILLKATERTSALAADMIAGIVIGFIIIVSVLLFCFAAAYYLSSLIGNEYSGFLIVGGCCLVFALIFIMFRKEILAKPFRNRIIRKIFEKENVKEMLTPQHYGKN